MRCILQLSTGSFNRSACGAEEAVKTLEYCMQVLDVEKVIFGWAADIALNQEISCMLDRYPVEKYLWLPVFAEIQDREGVLQNRNISDRKRQEINTCKEDAFDFVCQSSRENMAYAVKVFDRLTTGCHMDGVFLDRIRYASAAGGSSELYGCWCPHCQDIYEKNGVDTERVRAMEKEENAERFIPSALERGIYRYGDQDIDRLMAAKRQIITSQVGALCERFHSRGLKVGADTFAPSIADFVGQDIDALAEKVDFVKPMAYIRTDAPAGIPFELRALGDSIKKRIDKLWEGDTGSMETLVRQMQELKGRGYDVAPGIDANRIEGICDADTAYVKDFLRKLDLAGIDRAVLSWNILQISKETIRELADVMPASPKGNGIAI